MSLKVVFIVAHDAYLKGARNICRLLERRETFEAHWFTTSKLLAAQGLDWLEVLQARDVEALQQADLIFAGLGGRDLNRLIHSLKGGGVDVDEHRPVIVGYFPGVLHLRIFEALATRLRCDRVLLNCKRDYRLYRRLARATIGKNNGLLLGAPWIGEPPLRNQHCDIDLLFVEQSFVPEARADRVRLVEHLAQLARQQPDWRIVIALRARKGEASSHQLEDCLEEIAQQMDSDDLHLEFVLGDIDQLLARACRVATISSSVAFTSLAWRKPTLFINDLGVRQSWGNDLFRKSGYMSSLHRAEEQLSVTTGWCKLFIKLPQSRVLGKLRKVLPASEVKAIPGMHANNRRLRSLVQVFCLKYGKNQEQEINKLFRTINNINRQIYKI